jgi:DICT domain-containing protein/GGDEF domain-containing protein
VTVPVNAPDGVSVFTFCDRLESPSGRIDFRVTRMRPRDNALLTKRVLVDLSHCIEQFALAADPGDPLVVIALFQQFSYFHREAAVYREIADRGAVTLVGVVAEFPPELPFGVRHQLLAEDDPLAREWSVTVLGPHGGAALLAIDQETVRADAPTLEQGREFHGGWSFRREDAYQQVLRLRSQLALPAATVAEIDAVLQSVVGVPEPRHQGQWDAPLRLLARRVEGAVRGRDRARAELTTAHAHAHDRDPRTGLHTAAHFERWTAGLGRGTLSIGLVALRLVDVARVRTQYGMRAEMAATQSVGRALQQVCEGADRVVQIGRDDFLFVLPSATTERVVAVSREASACVERLDEQYPFVALDTVAAATVTRERPLPVHRLVEELHQMSGGPESIHLLTG